MIRISILSRPRAIVELATPLAMAFTLVAYAGDSDTEWQAIQQMDKSVANSRNVVAACSRFTEAYDQDKHVREAQQHIKDLTSALQRVPAAIRDQGIPLANGVAINLAGAMMLGGNVDLKNERSGLMVPHEARELPNVSILEDRSTTISRVQSGMSLSEVVKTLGNYDDMFEQADGDTYQKVIFYAMKGKQTAILWLDKADRVTLLYVAETAAPSDNR
jgi:hypothetical protein